MSLFNEAALKTLRTALSSFNALSLLAISIVGARINPVFENMYAQAGFEVPGTIRILLHVTQYSRVFFFLSLSFLLFLSPHRSLNRLSVVIFLGGCLFLELIAIVGFIFSTFLFTISLGNLVS